MTINPSTASTCLEGGLLNTLQTWADIFQGFATTLGVIAAGFWSWLLFVRQRQRFPRAEATHKITFIDLTPSLLLARITVAVENVGSVLIQLVDGYVEVYQIRPVQPALEDVLVSDRLPLQKGGTELDWPMIGRREFNPEAEPHEIEPSESDEYHFDFIIPSSVKTVAVYSYFRNTLKGKREIGWNHTTLCEVNRCGIDSAEPKEENKMAKVNTGGKSGGPKGQGTPKKSGASAVHEQGPPKGKGGSGKGGAK